MFKRAFCLVTVIFCLSAFASTPTVMNYQGRLTDNTPSQNPINTTVDIVFTIHDHATNDSPQWTESWTGVSVNNGIFSVLLGSNGTPIPASVFTATADLWLELEIDLETLSPRQKLGSVGYAFEDEAGNEYNTGLTLNGTDLELTDGDGTLTTSLATLQDGTGTDDQTLSFTNPNLSIEGGNTVDLSALSSADNLGNHTATTTLNMGTHVIDGSGPNATGDFIGTQANSAIRIGVDGGLNTTASPGNSYGNLAIGNYQIYTSGDETGNNVGAPQGLVIQTQDNPDAEGNAILFSVQSSANANRLSVVHGLASGYTNQFYDSLAIGAEGDTAVANLTSSYVDFGQAAQGDLWVADDAEIRGDLYTVGGATVGDLSGTGTRMVTANASGLLATQALPSGDNLGNHTATTNLDMNNFEINGPSLVGAQPTDTYDKIRVWNSSSYTMGMKSAQSFGFLNDWAMTFTMPDDADRGWLWRDINDTASEGAMSLSTGGNLFLQGYLASYDFGAFEDGLAVGALISPSADLHVKQSADTGSVGGIRIESAASSGNWMIRYAAGHLFLIEDSFTRAYIETGTGAYIQVSDREKKTDLKPLMGTLDRVLKLRPFHYRYLGTEESGPSSPVLGFMAQDVEELFPTMVKRRENGEMGLAYSEFGVLAIAAIQEQQEIIDSQQERLEKLEAELEELKKLLTK